MIGRCTRGSRIAIALAMLICGDPNPQAQSYSASGQIGYLQEWEIEGQPGKNDDPR